MSTGLAPILVVATDPYFPSAETRRRGPHQADTKNPIALAEPPSAAFLEGSVREQLGDRFLRGAHLPL